MQSLSAEEYRAYRAHLNQQAIQNNRKALQDFHVPPPPTRVVGIDPAFRKGGLGVCVIDEGRVTFHSFAMTNDLLDWLRTRPLPRTVVIENSNLQNATFGYSGTRQQLMKISRNVGANQAVSAIIVEECRRLYGEGRVVEVSPQRKGSKWCMRTAVGVAESLGLVLPKRMGQDKRDAFQLACRVVDGQRQRKK